MIWVLGVVVALAVVVAISLWARSTYRRHVRRQVIELLRVEHPEVTVVHEGATALELRLANASTGTMGLSNLYTGLAMGGRTEPEVEREAIRAFVKGVMASLAEVQAPLSLDEHGERLMPRLASASLVATARQEAKPLVHRPTGVENLVVVYVVDSEQSVMYLGEERLAELGIDGEALHQRAMANLRRFPLTEMVRDVVERQRVTMVRVGDSYDAARLLLVPETLGEGEELVAVIPDRETLCLLPVPAEGGWTAVNELARTAASPYLLLQRPLRVTRAGFRPV